MIPIPIHDAQLAMDPVQALSQPVTLPLWMHWVTLLYSGKKAVDMFRALKEWKTDDKQPNSPSAK